MPIKYYQKTDKGIIEAEATDTSKLLSKRPNPFMTPTTFWNTVEINRNHYGNAYVYMRKKFDRKKYGGEIKIVDLWVMQSNCVQIVVDDAGIFAGVGRLWYVYTDPTSGRQYVFSTDEVMHFKTSFSFDGITGALLIYDRIGSDRGCYFMEGLNLRKISLKSDTYDFYTRIYPIGKDGITPEWLTGKDYIDNFQYSSKIKAYVWKDERYTNTTSLIEDATAKIEEMSRPYKAYTAEVVDLAKASEKYKDILSYGIGDTVTLVSKKTRTKEKQRIVKITEYPETPEKNTVEISNARKTFAEIQKEETAAATEEAISISNRATKKVLENYSTTEEIETKITASKKAVEAGVAYTLKNYYTSVQMDSLIKATKEEISQEVKHVEENSMHNYVVNGDFSNGLDDNWYNSNETNNSVMDVSGLGTVAKILKTSSSSSYIRQNLGKIPAGTYRVRYKAATAAGYESTARVQVGALGSYSTTSSGMLKSKEFTTIEREITVSEGTKYIYIYAYTQNAPVYITDIEVLGLYSLYADAKIQVTAEEITSEVKKKVNSDDFGTLITQNAYNVRVAFNNGSSYMQFDSTGITMYTGTITDNTKRTRFDYNGEHFYRDGKYVGKIGTNTMIGNDSQRGLVFDIEYDTAYMSWANKESANGSSYMMKWAYCTQQCNNYEARLYIRACILIVTVKHHTCEP